MHNYYGNQWKPTCSHLVLSLAVHLLLSPYMILSPILVSKPPNSHINLFFMQIFLIRRYGHVF